LWLELLLDSLSTILVGIGAKSIEGELGVFGVRFLNSHPTMSDNFEFPILVVVQILICMNFFWSQLHSQLDSHERYCECGGPLRDIIVNFGNTFEHVPSMEDQHDAAWVHCLTLERNDKSTWMRVAKWWRPFVYFHLYHALQQLEYSQTCIVLIYNFRLHQTEKAVINAAASIETAVLTSLASENHSERLNSWPQQLLLPYWISMFVWFYLCERSLWTRKADLVLVLGSSLSVPTACDLPEICLEARDGKPETCRQAEGIRNRGCS